jgi:HAD superfamily hydrolase (TIGR01549 family)
MLDTSRIKGLCFDVDGTLNDTDDLWVQTVTRRISPLSGAARANAFARWAVMTLESPMNLAYELLDFAGLDDEVERLLKWIESRREKRTTGRFKLIGAADQTLEKLASRYPLTVVSARDAATTEQFLDTFDIKRFFQSVVTSQTCPRTKPSPDPIIAAANAMALSPHECLMIGDTTVDMRSARAAGAQAVGVLCGFGSPRELNRAGAARLLPDPDALLEIL